LCPRQEDEVYSEQVVLLGGQGIWYRRPSLPSSWQPRSSFGLAERWTLYLCPQSVFKLHPRMDPVFKGVLERDPQVRCAWMRHAMACTRERIVGDRASGDQDGGRVVMVVQGHLVLLEGRRPRWTAVLRERLEAAGVDMSRCVGMVASSHAAQAYISMISVVRAWRRVHFLPRVSAGEEYMQLLRTADVVLHPFPFGGSRTSAEGQSASRPFFTCHTWCRVCLSFIGPCRPTKQRPRFPLRARMASGAGADDACVPRRASVLLLGKPLVVLADNPLLRGRMAAR
jgi:hypothetical protein